MAKIKDFTVEMKVLNEAATAASHACAKMLADNPGVWYPCGFSWVTIKPARGKLIDALKHFEIGHTSEEGGYMIYNPAGHATQWMDAKMAGSRAYVEVLRKYYPDGKLKFKAVERID